MEPPEAFENALHEKLEAANIKVDFTKRTFCSLVSDIYLYLCNRTALEKEMNKVIHCLSSQF